MKFSSRRQADLCPTSLAIRNNSVAYKSGFSASESGGFESMEPSRIMQMLRATFFREKVFLKIKPAALEVSFVYSVPQVRGTIIIIMN